MPTPPIVVMGVSGCGKSTVGAALAAALHVDFEDGDDLHPPSNVAKMAAGQPLDDADRAPWLDAVGTWLGEHRSGGVIACSALKRTYRDVLRAHATDAAFLYLDCDADLIEQRVSHRPGHFMPASLVASQLATLEPLQPDEAGAAISGNLPVDAIVGCFLTALDDVVLKKRAAGAEPNARPSP